MGIGPEKLGNQGRETLTQDVTQLRIELLEPVGDSGRGQRHLDDPTQVDGRTDHHGIDDVGLGHGIDGRLEIGHLFLTVAHGGQERPDVGVDVEGVPELALQPGPGIDDLAAERTSGHHAGAEVHATVGTGRPILDHQHALVLDQLRLVDGHGRRALDDLGQGVFLADGTTQLVDVGLRGGVHLVDDDHVGHQQVLVTGVVGQLVTDTKRVDHHDQDVGRIERGVVVAAVPDDDVGLLLGLVQDGAVVDTSVDDAALGQMRLVLFHLLDGALVLFQVADIAEALHSLLGQITVGHGVADRHHPMTVLLEELTDVAGGLRLAATGTNGADGHDGFLAVDHGGVGPHHHEIGAGRIDPLGQTHDVAVRHVRVGEDAGVDSQSVDLVDQLGLVEDGNPFRVEFAGQFSRVDPSLDVRNLGGGKAHHLEVLVVAEQHVEVVEVASRGSQDQNPFSLHQTLLRKNGWVEGD